jgi:hypothetical protein
MSPASPATEMWALFLRATGYKSKTATTYMEGVVNRSAIIPAPERATLRKLLRWRTK